MFDFSESLGKSVKKARLAQGLTQSNIAEQISADPRTIINIENYHGNPKMEILYPLIRTLRIDPWDIFYSEQPQEHESLRKLQLILKDCSEEEFAALIPVCEAVLSVLRAKNSSVIE